MRRSLLRSAAAASAALTILGLCLAGTAAASPTPGSPRFGSGNNGFGPPSSGSAQQINGPGGGQAAQLTSNQYGYGLVSVSFPAGSTFSQLSQLSTNFTMTQGMCGGGAPRYQIDLQPPGDTNPSDGVSLYVYFGTPPYGGCPSGGPQTEANIIGGTAPQWFILGGSFNPNVPYTYSQVESMVGNYSLLDTQIADDGGWSQTPTTQQVVIQNWNVNGTIFFASPGGNVTCTGALPPGTYQNVDAKSGCVITSSDIIQGNLTVDQGGTLWDQGAPIGGNLQANQAQWLAIGYGGSVGGNVEITGTTGAPPLGGAGTITNPPQNYLCNTVVGGNVSVQNNSASSPFEVGGGADCAFALTVTGNLTAQNNAGGLTVGGSPNPTVSGASNVVKGNVQVQNNTGGGTLTNNQAGQNCQLQGDKPGIVGSGNTTPAGHTNTCNAMA